ncbi:hypothetical protein PG996_013963 [Apiospora saccharicola]|uniref:Uncharacterized protein n=1 Tax=Apiospora saccharicola TaxID=335842 RepID=A0ABR1TGZ7_9PEZI
MQYSASFTAVVAVAASLVAPAVAMFDSKACNGIGACTVPSDCNYNPSGEPQQPEWDCGSAGTINGQIGAGAEINFEMGLRTGTVVEAADFPKNCNLAQPGSNATLLKSTFNDVTIYGWIEYSCTETTKITNGCYSRNLNPSKYVLLPSHKPCSLSLPLPCDYESNIGVPRTFTCKVLKNGQECKNIANSFHALCRVNKRLRAVAEPRLYSELRWAWRFTWPEAPPHPYPMNIQVPPFIPFLRTISSRPELATFVRTIDLSCGSFNTHAASCHMKDKPPLPTVGADMNALIGMVHSFGVQYAHCWVKQLRRGRAEAFVALLLALTPNLQHLHMDEEYLPEHLLGDLLATTCGRQTSAGGIHESMDVSDFSTRLSQTSNTVDLLSLFYWPAAANLCQLSGTLATPSAGPAAREASPKDILSLNLTMRRENYVRRVLSTTKKLETLRWRWPGELFSQDLNEIELCFRLDTAMRCVSHVRESLTDLAITVGHVELEYAHHYDTVTTRGSMIELAGFPRLRSLEVPLIFLTRSFTPDDLQPIEQSLPPSLESLTIIDTASFGMEWDYSPDEPFNPVDSWLENWKLSTPRLSQVRFLLEETERQDWGHLLADYDDEELSELFGLRFEVVHPVNDLKAESPE